MTNEPSTRARAEFWLRLEVSLETLRDDGESDLLRIVMRDN